MVPRGIAGDVRLFRGLRWRLTSTYVLVTAIAAVAMSATLAVIQTSDGQTVTGPVDATDVVRKSTVLVAPYLGDLGSDQDTLYFSVSRPLWDDLAQQFPGQVAAVAVVDARGVPLAPAGCTSAQSPPPSPARCEAIGRSTLAPVFADPTAVSAIIAETRPAGPAGPATGRVGRLGFVAASVPEKGRSGPALLAVFHGPVPTAPAPNRFSEFLALWRNNTPLTWLPLLLAIVVLGAAAGLLLSARLVGRLRSMAATVGVWSHGNLAPVVDTAGRDELANLAADLNHMAEQVRDLLAVRAEITKVQERQRFRRDLHDGVKQELFAATLHIATARSALHGADVEVTGHLDAAERSTGRAQRELTAIMEQLPPPSLSVAALPDALTELGADFEHQAGFPLALTLPADLALPSAVEQALYRVSQEALTNIRWHAEATAAALTVTMGEAEVFLDVRDNGRGFVPDEQNRGAGIIGMRERIALLGGRFQVDSSADGTHVHVRLPVNADPDDDRG